MRSSFCPFVSSLLLAVSCCPSVGSIRTFSSISALRFCSRNLKHHPGCTKTPDMELRTFRTSVPPSGFRPSAVTDDGNELMLWNYSVLPRWRWHTRSDNIKDGCRWTTPAGPPRTRSSALVWSINSLDLWSTGTHSHVCVCDEFITQCLW